MESNETPYEAKVAPQAVEPTTVKTIRSDAGLRLVQWRTGDDQLRRSWVTPDMIVQDSPTGRGVLVDRPERGLPFGDDLQRVVTFNANAEAFVDDLHRRGVWTYEDVATRVDDVRAGLHAIYGVDLAAIVGAAKALHKSSSTGE